ncbi:MAG: sugar phosphate isomerase/epimerase [Verrucomicrobia bacterium]|nr:sugar phosphate isomerase/epimerase [Verrucomicrobiota bacterium]
MNPSVSRRDFLSTVALAAAAAPLAARAAEKSAAAPAPGAAPAGPSTLHVFSKPFYQMSHAETAKLIAACGFGGVDYTVRKAQAHVLPEKVAEDLPRAVDAARAAGLKVELITTDITSAREPHTEAILRAAAKVGVKCYRLGNFNYDNKLGVVGTLEKLQPSLKELAALNASLGLHGAIQNHAGTRVGSAMWDLHLLLRELDPKAIGVQFDIRHAVCEAGQSWPVALRLLAPWIRCTDIKDFKWEQAPGKATIDNVPLGEGVVPFDAYFKLAKELKIGGPISLHLEYPPFEKAPAALSAADRLTQMTALMKRDGAFLKAAMAKSQIT